MQRKMKTAGDEPPAVVDELDGDSLATASVGVCHAFTSRLRPFSGGPFPDTWSLWPFFNDAARQPQQRWIQNTTG